MQKLSWEKIRIPAAAVLLFSVLTAIIIPIYLDSRRAAAPVAALGNHTDGPVLVLDPGHGGLDGGAVAADGTTESVINLQIAQRTALAARLLGLPVTLTRNSEELNYPEPEASTHAKKVWDQKNRVETINATNNAVLISIHQNRFPDTRPSGSQALYAKTEGSRELAELVHQNLISNLNPDNRRVAAPISDSIYLMKQVNCPAILVECGFLSNPTESEKLKSGVYQTQIALTLLGSYLQYIGGNCSAPATLGC